MKIKFKDMTVEQLVHFCSNMRLCSGCPLSKFCYNCGVSLLETLLDDPFLSMEVDLDESE